MIIRFRKGLRQDEGASAVEYGLLVAAIAAVIVVVVFAFGSIVRQVFTNTCTQVSSGLTANAPAAATPTTTC